MRSRVRIPESSAHSAGAQDADRAAVDNPVRTFGCPQPRHFQAASPAAKRDKCYWARSRHGFADLTEEQAMTGQDLKAKTLADALARCGTLSQPSSERDELWITVRETVCTKGLCLVVPMGSSAPVPVTADHATDELIAAMDWLRTHESQARAMAPQQLFIMLRGVATKGAFGSARAAQSDALHGMTHVRPGEPVVFADLDRSEVA